MAYRESKQFQTLREQLREQGATIRTVDQVDFFEDSKIEKILIYRQDKDILPAVIIDHPTDGYQLFLCAKSRQIHEDVQEIMNWASTKS